MFSIYTKKGLVALFVFMLLLSACTSQSVPDAVSQPTLAVDTIRTESAQTIVAQSVAENNIRTEVAQTIIAQITVDAALHPSETPVPVRIQNTSTPVPNETEVPREETQISIATATKQPTQASVIRKPTVQKAYDCKVIDQRPRDGYKIAANGFFDVTWTVENTGTAIWEIDQFRYQYLSGYQFAKITLYKLTREVHPGSRLDMTVDFIAPDQMGKYTTWWKLADPNGVEVCRFFTTIQVDAPTYTPSPTAWY